MNKTYMNKEVQNLQKLLTNNVSYVIIKGQKQIEFGWVQVIRKISGGIFFVIPSQKYSTPKRCAVFLLVTKRKDFRVIGCSREKCPSELFIFYEAQTAFRRFGVSTKITCPSQIKTS